jgi:hypothetical protein
VLVERDSESTEEVDQEDAEEGETAEHVDMPIAFGLRDGL